MDGSYAMSNGDGLSSTGHMARHSYYQPFANGSLSWLDIRVFYVGVSKCEIDDSAPGYLTLNRIPLGHDTLLEVNGVRVGMNADEASSLLRRDRLDRKSEEATFVSTDSIRITGGVKFEVFCKDILVLSGIVQLCHGNGSIVESRSGVPKWNMHCESHITAGSSFLKAKQLRSPESVLPSIEVYVAGSFLGTPIILTQTLQLCSRNRQVWNGVLDSIPEYEAAEREEDVPPQLVLQSPDYPSHKPEDGGLNYLSPGTEYLDGEDGELSWFNAGVRVGVGIGLSVCVGVGIGVGLLVRTYQGTQRTFRRLL